MNNAFPSEDEVLPSAEPSSSIAIIAVGLLLVIGGAVFAFLSVHGETQSMTKEGGQQGAPRHPAPPEGRADPTLAKVGEHGERACACSKRSFVHLSWFKDKESIPAITKGLEAVDHAVRGTAAMALVGFGSPDADSAKPTLLKALGEAGSGDKPQICWALVVLKEPSAWDTIIGEYRLGHLSEHITRLDGYPAFDADYLASLVSIDKLAGMSGDSSDSVRQLVATTLSKNADPKWTDTLIKLVTDKEVEGRARSGSGVGQDRK